MVGGKILSSERVSRGGMSSGGPTVAVVNLVIALRGEELKRLGLDRSVNSVSGKRRHRRPFLTWEYNEKNESE